MTGTKSSAAGTPLPVICNYQRIYVYDEEYQNFMKIAQFGSFHGYIHVPEAIERRFIIVWQHLVTQETLSAGVLYAASRRISA